MNLIMNLFLGVMAIIVMVSIMPVVDDLVIDNRDGDNWNCASDPDYNASNEEHKMTCTVSFLISPFIMLGVIIAVIMSLMYGSRQPEQQYTQGY